MPRAFWFSCEGSGSAEPRWNLAAAAGIILRTQENIEVIHLSTYELMLWMLIEANSVTREGKWRKE